MPIVTLANGRSFNAERGISVLDAALLSGLTLEYSCHTGRCGTCKARVLSGNSRPLRDEVSLEMSELESGWILTCAREVDSDLALDIEDLSALAGLTPKTFPCRINGLERKASDVVRVELRLPPKSGFAFLAGQYVDVIGPTGVKRSYSIASSMGNGDKFQLDVRHVDGGTMSDYWFNRAQLNDLLRFRGPLGTFFLREVAGLDVVLLATGTGYAPIRSMLAQIANMDTEQRPKSVHLYWGGRSSDDLYDDPRVTLKTLHHVPVLSRAGATWTGARGHVQDTLLAHKLPLADAVVYACGSDAMIHAARMSLTAAGVLPKRFYSDAFVSSN
jgi:CDP-4-dehydro-6-deoxyglucose reductase